MSDYGVLCIYKGNMMSKKTLNHADLEKLQRLANWMDSRFIIPGTSIRFGLDSLLGLIPGIGDSITLASTVYFFSVARKYEMPFHIHAKILWNAFIDWIIGIIPLFGDIFDVGWKANQKNVALIKDHLQSQADTDATIS